MSLKTIKFSLLFCAIIAAGTTYSPILANPTDATEKVASEVAKQGTGLLSWVGSSFNLGKANIGDGAITVDSEKASSIAKNIASSVYGWVMQNKTLTTLGVMYGCYRLYMNRIINAKNKELIENLTAATGAAITKLDKKDELSSDEKNAILKQVKLIATEPNLSFPSWILSFRWVPSWTPGASYIQNSPTSAANLTALEKFTTTDSITSDAVRTIHTIFTKPGL